MPRLPLDQAMRDLLAAKLELRRTAVDVTDIHKEGARHLRVTARTPQGDDTALDCDAVIPAHGAGSPLARRLGIDGLPLGARRCAPMLSRAGAQGRPLHLFP